MTRRLRTVAVVLLCGLTLALASCGDDPDADAAPPATVAPPAVPEQLAIGAWVQGADGKTDVDAVEGFEERVGRGLDVAHWFLRWDAPWPREQLKELTAGDRVLLLSWNGADTKEIVAGRHDRLIKQRAAEVRGLQEPVWLRWRWEMNRPNLADVVHGPADYRAAWTHVRDIFRAEGATNTAWVWCPLADKFASHDAADYYPGDDQVEWLCADVYPGSDLVSFDEVAEDFLTWAEDHDKPIMFAEFGASTRYPGDRAAWLRQAWSVFQREDRVKVAVYFEGRSQGDSSYDFTLEPGSDVLAAFRDLTGGAS